MENNFEPDLVVFEDDNGNKITMEVLDYFFYEGEEFATLVEYDPDDACASCENESCTGCENGSDPVDVTIMKIVPVGDDEEEFVPIDEALGKKLVEMLNSGAFEEIDDEE